MEKFINRELSWLEFNKRVLEEAEDVTNPLMERLKFISIVSSNLDEFFMIRVGSLWDQIKAGLVMPDISGLTPQEQITQISQKVHEMSKKQHSCYNQLIKLLEKEKMTFVCYGDLDKEQKAYADKYYKEIVYPVLTPIVIDQSRQFPLIQSRSLNTALLLRSPKKREKYFLATVQVPGVLSRYVELPKRSGQRYFILLEELVKEHLEELFDSHEIISYGHYRVTRNADLGYDEEEAEDLLATIQETLKKRKWGQVVRVEVEEGIDEMLLDMLKERLEVTHRSVYKTPHTIDLTFLMKFVGEIASKKLLYPSFLPKQAVDYRDADELFKKISKRDILLHHPYDDFSTVVDLVKYASIDSDVLAIKMTLYRVSGGSQIIDYLVQAAEAGKQVTVLVELKARFDEESNIAWARKLEKAGAHVIYGLVGLKTHSKVMLIVRKEKQKIKRYVHLSTGNYNDETARLYVDLGLLTADTKIGEDVTALFNMLSGYSRLDELNHLIVSPIYMKGKIYQLIEREIHNAKKGKKALMRVKINALMDEEVIEKLYEASQAGVKIEFLIRGICGLRPGVPGLSENISVKSIVGRFLEHSRIFYFYNDGKEEIYLGSADWMKRNLNRRVEIIFPVLDEKIRQKVKNVLEVHMSDTVKTRWLHPDGSYTRIESKGKETLDSQQYFITN